MVEIFTKPNTDSEAMRDYILQKTGMVPSIHDNGIMKLIIDLHWNSLRTCLTRKM